MNVRGNRVWSTAAMLVALSASHVAFGQPGGTPPEYDEGIQLFDQKKYPEAAEKFEQALEKRGEAKSLWSLALAEIRAERPLRALSHLEQYRTRPDAKPENVRRAERLIAELKSRVGHLRILAPDGAVISIDDKVVGKAPLATSLDVAPNEEHTIEAELGPKSAMAKRIPAAGEELVVHLEPRTAPLSVQTAPVIPSPPVAVQEKAPAQTVLKPESPTLFHTLLIGTFVSSFALGGTGGYLYMCYPDCGDHRVLGVALFGAGVAMHVGGYVLHAAWPRKPHAVTESRLGIAPSALPGGAGVTVVGAF